MKLRTSPNFFV